jgi:hypothetical protein
LTALSALEAKFRTAEAFSGVSARVDGTNVQIPPKGEFDVAVPFTCPMALMLEYVPEVA